MTGAVARASRHRLVNSAKMIAMALIFAGAVGYFLYAAGAFSDWGAPKPKTVLQSTLTRTVTVVDPKITRFGKKSRTYIIRAASAIRSENQPDIVYLKLIDAEIRDPNSRDRIYVTADQGTFNSKTDEMILKHNIRVRTLKGYRAFLSSAHIWLKQGRMVSNNPVIVYMPKGTIAANGLEMLENGKHIRFLNRARMVIDADKAKPNAK